MLFPQILSVACRFIDLETTNFLSAKLPNTGLPPHFYCSADKSTNDRICNQAIIIYPVVEGKRAAIPLDVNAVYITSEGEGARGSQLARNIFNDLEKMLELKTLVCSSCKAK